MLKTIEGTLRQNRCTQYPCMTEKTVGGNSKSMQETDGQSPQAKSFAPQYWHLIHLRSATAAVAAAAAAAAEQG